MISAYATAKKTRPDAGDGRFSPPLSALVLLLAALMVSGCAKKVTGPRHLYPSEPPASGYSVTRDVSTFENGLIKITVRPLRPWKESAHSPLLDELLSKNYVILTLAIENRSREKTIYDPVHTSLVDDGMGYGRPLNYTDLYEFVSGREGGKFPASELKALEGRFYDLSTTIPPGGKASKLLIFPPLEEKGKKAVLRIRELYIGTDAFSVNFPFTMEGAEGAEGAEAGQP